jgi:methionyl aminopeptidase
MIDARPITLRSNVEIEAMKRAGRIVAEVLAMIRAEAQPGVATGDLDAEAERIIRGHGAVPAFKGYQPPGRKPFPSTLCTSIDDEIVHGIPGKRKLEAGQILSVDVGVKLDDHHGDAALTVPVGSVSAQAERLMRATEESLHEGIGKVQVGNRVSDIGAAVQAHVEAAGFSVVREFVGHGIGTRLHEPPEIPNFGRPGFGPRIQAGMAFAIEPMVNAGGWRMRELEDGWTAVTADGSLSAHFEHTVAATENGPLILTVL